jgi:hypothetical protein
MDDLFREKLLNFEQEPPAYLLENILAKTAADRRKKKVIFWRVAGVAAGLLLAFIAGWQVNYLNNQSEVLPVEMAKSEIPGVKNDNNRTVPVTDGIQNIINSKVVAERTENIPVEKAKDFAALARKIRTALPDETTEVRGIEGKSDLETLRRIDRRLKSTDYNKVLLAEIKSSDQHSGLAELTIDEQIIKQNQEMLSLKKSEKDKAKWIVGALVAPVYSVSRSSHTQTYASNMLNSTSSNPVDLGGGILVEVKPGKRWSLQSGVYYSALGQSSGNSFKSSNTDQMFVADPTRGTDFLNTNVSIDPASNKMLMNSTAGVIEFFGIPDGIEIGTNIEDKALAPTVVVSEALFTQNFEYIEIPVYLRYTLIDSRFDVEMLGGFSSNVLVGNQTYMESGSGNNLIGKTRDMQTVNYSGTVGVGLKYGLSKRLFLNVEPRIKYYLNSLNSSVSVTYKPYTIGVYSGLSFQF